MIPNRRQLLELNYYEMVVELKEMVTVISVKNQKKELKEMFRLMIT